MFGEGHVYMLSGWRGYGPFGEAGGAQVCGPGEGAGCGSLAREQHVSFINLMWHADCHGVRDMIRL